MFKNLTIASRFLQKHKGYTTINAVGLTLSFVSCLFIALYIYDELGFDRFHSHYERIYRVIEHDVNEEGATSLVAEVPFRVSSLGVELPEIENSVKLTVLGRANFLNETNQNKIYEPLTLCEQSFFDIFSFKVLHGSRQSALTEPYTLVLTKTTAERLFGEPNAVGKVIQCDRFNQPLKVTAIIEDFPANSHMRVNLLVAFQTFASANWYIRASASDWTSNYFNTYLLTRDGTNVAQLEESITNLVNQNRDSETLKTSFSLQPLKDIHFNSADIGGGYAWNPGELHYLYIFGAVGIFVLVISAINYINLSTSLSITRGKEVGVKKVAGAGRGNLIRQFLAESIIVSFLSLIVALVIVNMLLPSFNTFVEKEITMKLFLRPEVAASVVTFTILMGVLAGLYPAVFLSKFKPVVALKGFSRKGSRSSALRQTLVVFQFALSIILILATLVAEQQLSFIRNKDLGFQKDQIVVLDINSGDVRRGFQVIKNEITKIPAVRDVSVSSRVPGEWKNIPQVGLRMPGQDHLKNAYFMGADADFLSTFEIELIAGRTFSDDILSDSLALLINETAARDLGLVEPLNSEISIENVNFDVGDERLDQPFNGKIIGIVRDFHFQSLYQEVAPLVIAYRNNPIQAIDYFSVRLAAGNSTAIIAELEKALHVVDPSQILEYNFLDQRLQEFYRQDAKRGKLFTIAAIVAIGLACLGLFSLVSFVTEQRTKEIGIRKALGATTAQIVRLLSAPYIGLVIIGFALAAPFAIWALNSWLQSFAYRIEIGWVTIAAACIISILIAFLTVCFKSLKAALENPVNSLRSE